MHTVAANSALIVDGLPLSMTSETLTDLFTPFGKVIWARVVMDRYRRSLSYGYVVMEVDVDAAKAVQALDGKMVR
jgi:RNA recognition motif-containing protein